MSIKGFRVAGNVLTFFDGTDHAVEARKPYNPEEDERVTLLRHLFGLKPRSDDAVWVTGLTAGELDLLAEMAENLADVANGNRTMEPSERGELLAARAVMKNCAKLRDSAPTVSRIVPTAEPERVPEPVELDPLVELLRLADKSYSEAHDAASRAGELRQAIRRSRDEKIAQLAHLSPAPTNEQLGAMFDIDPSQVSRIISAQTRRNSGRSDVNLQMG